MTRASFASLLLLVACGAGTPSVVFQGQTASPLVGPDEMLRAPSVPRGARELGTLSVNCTPDVRFEAFTDRSLAHIDCSTERLTRMLEEAGAAAGGDVLVALECGGAKFLSCSARLARRDEREARTAPRPSTGNVFGELGAEIRISFAPSEGSPGRAPRALDNVRELPALPPSHRIVGSLEARCDSGCPELAVRDGLRIAAGRLGIEDVVGVRCFDWHSGYRCLGSAAVAERVEGFTKLPQPGPRPTRTARAPRSHPAG